MLTPESTSHSANLFTISPHQKFNENMHKNDRQLAVTTDAMKFKNEKDGWSTVSGFRSWTGQKMSKILPYFEKLQNLSSIWISPKNIAIFWKIAKHWHTLAVIIFLSSACDKIYRILNTFKHQTMSGPWRGLTHRCHVRNLMTSVTTKTRWNSLPFQRCPTFPLRWQNTCFSVHRSRWRVSSVWTSASTAYTTFQHLYESFYSPVHGGTICGENYLKIITTRALTRLLHTHHFNIYTVNH